MKLPESLHQEITQICPARYRRGRELTTIQTGDGECLVAYPRNEGDLVRLLGRLDTLGVACQPIGSGSNCIIADRGLHQVLISLTFDDTVTVDNVSLRVPANFSMMQLARLVVKYELAGLEFMAGIPGTVGGGVVMNAGAHGSEMCDVLDSVDIVTTEGKQILPNAALKFAYRHSILQTELRGAVVIGANFTLKRSSRESILAKVGSCLQSRKQAQPLQYPSFGSVFRNLPTMSAWQIVEECGLRGYEIGGCEISMKHPNWIINPKKKAQSADAISLMDLCKERAFAKGYQLQSEVKLLGC